MERCASCNDTRVSECGDVCDECWEIRFTRRPEPRRYDSTVRLGITCIQCDVYRRPYCPFHAEVPTWLVGAITIAFHSAHEGHRLRLNVDGIVYDPGAHPGVVPTPR